MATTEIIDVKLRLDTGNSMKSIEDLERELQKFRDEIKTVSVGSDRFKELQNSIVAADSRLKNINKSIEGLDFEAVAGEAGKFAGGVGAIAGAFTLLGGEGNETMEQLQKKMNVALGIVMGVKGAMEVATSVAKLWKVAQIALNAAMAANPAAMIAIAVAALAAGVAILYEATRDVNVELKVMNELRDSTIEKMADERGELDLLVAVAKDENMEKKDREKAIKKLQETYPSYLKNLSIENINTKETAKNLKSLNKELTKKYMTIAAEEKLTELYKERFKIETDLSKSELSMWQAIKLASDGQITKEEVLAKAYENKSENLADNQKEIEAITKWMDKMDISIDGIDDDPDRGFSGLDKNIKKTKKSLEDLNKETLDFLKNTQEVGDLLAKQKKDNTGLGSSLFDDDEELEDLILYNDILQAKIDAKIASDDEMRQQEIFNLQTSKAYAILNAEQRAAAIAAINKKYAEEKQQTDQAIADAMLADASSLFGSLNDLAEQYGKEGNKTAKAFAMAQILIDTALAFSSLVASSEGNPANAVTFGGAGVLQFIAGTARIIGNIASATAMIQKAEKGYYVQGKSHAQGGEMVNMEAGEFVMNKKSVAMFPEILNVISKAAGGVGVPGSGGDIIDYERLAGLINDKMVVIDSTEMTRVQERNVKISDRARI